MRKPITTRLHGIIDYTWAAAASSAAARMHHGTSTARLLRAAANVATGSALLTNYEYGVLRVVPMRGHLAMDVALCAALIASPLFLPSSERRHAAIPLLFGLGGLATALLTQGESPFDVEEEFGGLYGGGERAVADAY